MTSFRMESYNKEAAAIGSLICGILPVIGFPLFSFGGMSYLLFGASIIATGLGIAGFKSAKKKIAIAGLILGILSFIGYLIAFFLVKEASIIMTDLQL